jgi:hypothetical protein
VTLPSKTPCTAEWPRVLITIRSAAWSEAASASGSGGSPDHHVVHLNRPDPLLRQLLGLLADRRLDLALDGVDDATAPSEIRSSTCMMSSRALSATPAHGPPGSPAVVLRIHRVRARPS